MDISQAAGPEAALEALKESEQRFRLLVESSPNAIVMAAADGTVAQVNRQAEVLFGCHRDELIGQPVEVLVPERFRPKHHGYRQGFVADPKQRPMGAGRDLFAVRKDGVEFPVEIGLTPIHTPEGLRVMATITDITERKRAEEELKTAAAELARSNQDLEQFAHVVSHDLQEPLRMVEGHLQIIEEQLADKLDDDLRKSMHFAIDGATRMQAMIQDFLAFARVGKGGGGFAPTDMEAVLQGVLGDLEVRVRETGAAVRHEPLPTVQADERLMAQLLGNLVGNAIKYVAAGVRPEIEVRAAREDRGWRLAVKDNGIGIEPGSAEQIFKMFQRLHTRREYPGTGIGLAICKRIVEHHGGRIGVESAPGQGSTFWFTIPDRPGG